MAPSLPASDPAEACAAALVLLNELRAAFALPSLSQAALSESTQRELLEALPLLTLLSSMLRADSSEARKQDVLLNWDKALRRRGWSALPTFSTEGGQRTASVAPAESSPVRALLACFGAPIVLHLGPQTTVLAEALAAELLREIEALRALPLRSPTDYATRHDAIVERWNTFAERCADVPRIPR